VLLDGRPFAELDWVSPAHDPTEAPERARRFSLCGPDGTFACLGGDEVLAWLIQRQ